MPYCRLPQFLLQLYLRSPRSFGQTWFAGVTSMIRSKYPTLAEACHGDLSKVLQDDEDWPSVVRKAVAARWHSVSQLADSRLSVADGLGGDRRGRLMLDFAERLPTTAEN
jgi:DNA-binding transcriptional regulator YdaS (Cro superfamily)